MTVRVQEADFDTGAELDRLEAAGIIGEAPIPASQRRPRSSALLHDAVAKSAG